MSRHSFSSLSHVLKLKISNLLSLWLCRNFTMGFHVRVVGYGFLPMGCHPWGSTCWTLSTFRWYLIAKHQHPSHWFHPHSLYPHEQKRFILINGRQLKVLHHLFFHMPSDLDPNLPCDHTMWKMVCRPTSMEFRLWVSLTPSPFPKIRAPASSQMVGFAGLVFLFSLEVQKMPKLKSRSLIQAYLCGPSPIDHHPLKAIP